MKDNKVEVLLNNIYSQADLKEGVFDYVQPFIMRAYALLRNDELNKENGKTENILFRDIDSKNQVEDILYRDLPGIIDVYTKFPLDYRNEKLIKNSQTHRQLLIENLGILTTKLKQLEHNAYEHFDTSMKVSNRFIKEKYNDNFVNLTQVETEKEMKLHDKFNWFNYRQENEKSLSQINTQDFAQDDNKKIVLQEDSIEYKVKDRHRHFMAGVYDAYTKFAKKMENIKDSFDTKTYHIGKHFKRNSTEYIFLTIVLSVVSVPIIYHLYSNYLEQPGKDIEKIALIIDGSENFRDLTIKALDKFAKENEVILQYTPDKDAVYAYKDMSKTRCVHTIEYMNSYRSQVTGLNYYINDKLIEKHKTLSPEMTEEICSLPKNTLTFGTFKLK